MSTGRILAVVALLASASTSPAQDAAPVRELSIAADVVASLDGGQLTREELLHYFETNATLLRKNIGQANAIHEEDDLGALVDSLFPRYLENRALILAQYRRFSEVKGPVIGRIRDTYGPDIPAVVLVPCLGLFSAGGWADQIEGTHYVFVALERLPEDWAMDTILTHEIVHGISETDGSTVLGGFYDEGHATYVSAVLWPGREEEAYFIDMDEERYDQYLSWIDRNRATILADSGKPFVVLDDVHKLYFTTSFSEVPNIAYVIGFHYVAFLNERYTLDELRTFGMKVSENRREFEAFILGRSLGRRTESGP